MKSIFFEGIGRMAAPAPASASAARNRSFSNNGNNGSSVSGVSSRPTLRINNAGILSNTFSNGRSSVSSSNRSNSSNSSSTNNSRGFDSPRSDMNRNEEDFIIMTQVFEDTMEESAKQLNTIDNPDAFAKSVLKILEMVYEDEPTRTLRLPEEDILGYMFVRTAIDKINKIPDINPMAMFKVFQKVVEDINNQENDPNNGPNANQKRNRKTRRKRNRSNRSNRRNQRNERNTRRYRKRV